MSTAGWVLMGIGPASIIGGTIMMVTGPTNHGSNEPSAVVATGIALMVLGSVSTCVSVPLLSIGYYRQHNAYQIYNSKCTSSRSVLSFNLTAGQNGLGIAMNF